jgi:alkanesulfonate monooxygenase SsuD/methylene tetrahydromethanopterin reductase-like flavin-dependent oxidoreductase (luciferase family)
MAYSILRFDMRAPDFTPTGTADLYSAALDMAAWADEHGFDTVTLSEHHAAEDGFLPAPIPLMGCLVGRTRKVRLSVVALLLPLYDPIKLAEDLAILDIASGGRVSIVAGLGYRPIEYEMFGVDWKGRGRVMDESLDAIVRVWRGEPIELRGRRVHLTPRPLTQPTPPIFVGGMGKLAARRAARFGLPFQPAVNDPEVIETYQAECQRLGVERPLALPPGSGEMIWVSRDPERTWDRIGHHLLHDARTYASWQPANQRSAVHSDATTLEELKAEGKYRVLTPEQCIERAKAQGAFATFIHYPLCGGTPPEIGWESLELYASEVLPHID